MEILNHAQTLMLAAGGTLAVLALIALGIRVMFAGEGGVRKAIQGFGTVLIGIILVGGAVGIAGAIMSMAKGF